MKDMKDTAKGRLLDAIAGLAQDVDDSRNAFYRDRRLPDTLFAALADAGLFRLWLPVELGGAGLSPPDFLEVVEAASALDGSVGWLVGNGGGAVCEVDEGRPAGQGQRILVYVPRTAVTILDTWRVSGLRATGSCDFVMADIDVAADFTHDFQAVPTSDGAIYRLPAISAFCFTVATVPLGIATGARNAFTTLATGHKRSGGAVALAQREAIQSEVGRVETLIGASRAYLRATMSDLCAEVVDGGPATEGARL